MKALSFVLVRCAWESGTSLRRDFVDGSSAVVVPIEFDVGVVVAPKAIVGARGDGFAVGRAKMTGPIKPDRQTEARRTSSDCRRADVYCRWPRQPRLMAESSVGIVSYSIHWRSLETETVAGFQWRHHKRYPQYHTDVNGLPHPSASHWSRTTAVVVVVVVVVASSNGAPLPLQLTLPLLTQLRRPLHCRDLMNFRLRYKMRTMHLTMRCRKAMRR